MHKLIQFILDLNLLFIRFYLVIKQPFLISISTKSSIQSKIFSPAKVISFTVRSYKNPLLIHLHD